MDKYRVVLDVAETHSISKTAAKLNYTQSAVSQSIKNFEKEIGMPLFTRTKRGMELRPNTDVIIDSIRNIERERELILESVARITNLEQGCLRIGSIQSMAYHVLPGILKEFSEEYPNIDFDLSVHDFKELTQMMDASEIDCAFTSGFTVKKRSFVPICRDELMVVMPKDHPLTEKLHVDLADLRGEKYVLSADGLDYETGELFRENGIDPDIRLSINEDYAVLRMVEEGFGLTVLPKLLLRGIRNDVCIRPFTEHYYRTLGIECCDERLRTVAVKKLIDCALVWSSRQDVQA